MTTLSSDLTPASGNGYAFVASDQSVFVTGGTLVQSHDASAVYSTYSNSLLDNYGTLSRTNAGAGATPYAVYLVVGGTAINRSTGLMSGGTGLFSDNSPASITNLGTIWGVKSYGVMMRTIDGTSTLANQGHIFGHVAGAYFFGSSSPAATGQYVLDNRKTIDSDGAGILVQAQHDLLVTITNARGASIKGTTGAIGTEDFGHVVVTNRGTLAGGIDCNAVGNDKITNLGRIQGSVHLGLGADRFKGLGGNAVTVLGEAGADVLVGSADHDRLEGGLGRDTLTGKGGADVFDYSAKEDSPVGNQRDFITDFSRAQHDRIDLRSIDAKAGGSDDHFTFRGAGPFTGTGQLRYVLHDRPGTANDTTTVYGNVEGNTRPDFQIDVKGLVHFVGTDFFL